MLDGRGIEAVRLSALGSSGSIISALLLVVPLSWIFSNYYDYLMKYVGVLLLAIAMMMIKSEQGPWIEGLGSLVHWKYKAISALLFLTSGLLGIFAFEHESLISSPLGLEPQVLLPLLSGIFGGSSLLISYPQMQRFRGRKIPRSRCPQAFLPEQSSLEAWADLLWPGFLAYRHQWHPSPRAWARPLLRRSSWYASLE